MQGIESAIRSALTKADSADPAKRQRIYESVWSAHERAMAANTSLSDEQRVQRRERLKLAISQVEQEMREASQHASSRAAAMRMQPQSELDDRDDAAGQIAPELDQTDIRADPRAGRKRFSKAKAESDLGYETGLSQPKQHKKRNNSILLRVGFPLMLLAGVGLIGWSLYNSFSDMVATRGTASQRGNLGPLTEAEQADAKDWIVVFAPSQPERIAVQGKAKVEIAGEGNNRFARITSLGAGDTISFQIGEGVLSQLAGKKATFAINARSESDKAGGSNDMAIGHVSINCDFGALGDCGRKRYDVTDQRSDLLFDVAFKDASASGSGRIVFNSDVTGSGNSLDIYAIRIKIEQ